MSDNGFVFPGIIDPLYADADAVALHLAGLDDSRVALDPPDIAMDDQAITTDTVQDRAREQLPMFGPPFVQYVARRLDTLEKRIADKDMDRWQYEPTTVFFIASFAADANGNVNRTVSPNSVFLETSPGFTIALHRLTINVAGNNFGSPFTVAAGYWELRVNDEAIDGGSLVSGVGSFPVVKTWGTRDAPHIRGGELASIFVSGTGTFANKQVTVKAQGTQQRDESA